MIQLRGIIRYWAAGFAAALPLVALTIGHIPKVALGNFTDAVFYLSYARQFSELILTHGFLYYSTRFGGILPDAIAGHLFGEISGIWVLRWVLSAAVSLGLFLAFRKRYGLLAGLLASALWSSNPAALRLACTTYVDSMAVPFLIIGCCLVIFSSENGAAALLAGVLFGLATSAHLYAAFAFVLLMPCMIGACWGAWRAWLPFLKWTLAGFAITWVAGWLWYAVVWEMPGLLSPTIDLMRDLGNGQAAQWKKPIALALRETPAWFAPVALLPAALTAAWKGSPLMRGTACSLMLSAGFFWGGDLFGKAYVLSMPFYYSFLLPVTVLSAGAFCGEILIRQSAECARIGSAALLGIALMVPSLMARWSLGAGFPVVALLGSAVLLWVIWRDLAAKWLLAVCMPLLVMSSLAIARTGMFSQTLGHYSAEDKPVLELALRLSRVIPSAWSDQVTTRFWYDDDTSKPGGSDRRMIGAFWLHYFGKLTGRDGGYIPFGVMDNADATTIDDNGPGRIVVFDQDPHKVSEAVSVILAKGLPYTVAKEEELAAGSDSRRTLQVAILERTPPSSERTLSAKVSWHPMHRGRLLSSEGGATELLSSRIKWWDPLAEADLGHLRKGDRVAIPYTIRSGRIRFSLGERGKEPLVMAEKWPSDHESTLELTVPVDMTDAVVSLRNRYPTGSVSKIRVGPVLVFKNGSTP